jgi:spermidine/putrescine transport system permease protein
MKNNPCKRLSLILIWTWLTIFAIIPSSFTFITSVLTADPGMLVIFKLNWHNYLILFNTVYCKILGQSLYLAGSTTLICLLIGYPFAFIIARVPSKHRPLLLLLIIIPFWTSSLIRTYAIMALIKSKGLINSLLLAIGIIKQPLSLLYSYAGVLIGCVYDLLPLMILPLYTNIEKLNPELIEAASDLGSSKLNTLFKIVLPLTMPGILAGVILVFLPAMTMFYIPAILGGAKNILLGNLIENQFLSANNWPLGSAISVLLTIVLAIFILIYWHNSLKNKINKEELI